MKLYRYKHFDFERNFLPLGVQWKEKQVFAINPPDEDYYEVTNEAILIPLQESSYEESEIAGASYVRKIASTLKVYAQLGNITPEEASGYGAMTNPVSTELKKGWWHSAYYAHVLITPPDSLESFHEQIRLYIRSVVNSSYPSQFYIE
jgi:hypothetical protein